MNDDEWNEQDLLKGCQKHDATAQRILYERYSPILLGICRRYVKPLADAEDVFADAMIKIFERIGQFKGKGSFEGWMKRIAVNESLMFLRKYKRIHHKSEEELPESSVKAEAIQELEFEQLLALLDRLPEGYRTVFNLYVLEGLKHREVAEELGISINTSKSQLIQARKRLKEYLDKMDYPGIDKRGTS